MQQPTPQRKAPPAPHMLDEADIGSGETTPAQKDTEELIRQIPPRPPVDGAPSKDSVAPGQTRQ